MTAFDGWAAQRLARCAPAQTAERRRAEDADGQEFHRIQKFVSACRRRWAGATILLRAVGARTGANNPDPSTKENGPAAVPAIDRTLEEAGKK
jgi:hypothetical protein